MDGMMRTNTLSQSRVRHYRECGQTRENVTCEGVLFTLSILIYPKPSLRKRHAPTGFLRPWTKASFAAETAFSGSSLGTGELSSLLLGSECCATHFANFLALLSSFPDSPTIVFCLPRSGPFSLLCHTKSWKILLHPLVEYFRMYHGETSSSSGSIERAKASMSTFILTHFPGILPLLP